MSGRPRSTTSMEPHVGALSQCNDGSSSEQHTQPVDDDISPSLEQVHLDRKVDAIKQKEACACIGAQFSESPTNPTLMDISSDLDLMEQAQ